LIAWQDEFKRLLDNSKSLNLANIYTLQKLLTTYVYKERFLAVI